MKKDVMIVPKDKCPLDVLAEVGNRINDSWIFMHDNAVEKLRKTCTKDISNSYCLSFFFEESSDSPETSIMFTKSPYGYWYKAINISSTDMDFKSSADPEEIFFLKMKE